VSEAKKAQAAAPARGDAATGGVPSRILCGALLALGLAVAWAGAFELAPATAGLGLGRLGVLAVPNRAALVLLGLIIAGAGAYLGLTRRRVRTGRCLLAAGAAAVPAVCVWAASGTRLDLVGMLALGFRLSVPVALGAMAGILCEKSGIINIAIEGMMLAAACLGFTVSVLTGSVWAGLVAALAAGVLMALLHAVLSITFATDQIISGTVINMLAVGATGYLRRVLLDHYTTSNSELLPTWKIPLLADIPVLGPIFFENKPIFFAMLVLVPVLTLALRHTAWGLRTRAAGENPEVLHAAGVDVIRLRYLNVMLGGAVAGLAGAWFSLETTGTFEDFMTGGKGFIALAAMIFGNWEPVGALAGALIFGLADSLQIKLQILGLPVAPQFLWMLPYLITMVVLAGAVGRVAPPAAVGKPFVKQ